MFEINEMPWQCDHEDGCEAGWHLATYSDENNQLEESRYSDGDWETIEALPSDEEIKSAWQSYAKYVAKTGLDPLKEFARPRVGKTAHV